MTHLKKFRVLWILLAILILLAAVLLSSGCNVMKGKKSTTSDSTRVTTDNTGAVKSSEAGSEKESDYTRRTWIYGLPGASPAYMQTRNGQRLDTIALQPEVKNYYNTLPIAYIEESGKQKEKAWQFNYDSAWHAFQDSLSSRITITEKKKETKVLGWQHIIAACIGTALLILILQHFLKFKIVRK
jgi:predicted small secreted protein